MNPATAQRSIARLSNVFEAVSNIRPTGFQMHDVTLLTSDAYRKAYPGRSLVEVDNVRSTTFPAVPVNVGNAEFSGLIDLHGKDKRKTIAVDPYYNNSNGTRVLNVTLLQQNRIDSKPLDLVLWDFEGNVTFGEFNKDRTLTVVVFADKDISSLNFLTDGVFFTYNVNTTAGDKTGLNLLDVSDFYGTLHLDWHTPFSGTYH